jgi:hypothetical protein
MSHYTKVDCKVDNMDALKKALSEMGYGYREGSHDITSYGQTRTLELSVLRDKAQMPIGWIKEGSNLALEGDFYGTGINSVEFGNEVSRLHTKYKTEDWLKKKGYRVKHEVDEEGRMVVVGSKW